MVWPFVNLKLEDVVMMSPCLRYHVLSDGSINDSLGLFVEDIHKDRKSIFNLLTRQVVPDPAQEQAYFEELCGTPERLISYVTRGDFNIRRLDVEGLIPLLTESAQAECRSKQEAAEAYYGVRCVAIQAELDKVRDTPKAEMEALIYTTFWTRLLCAIWPPARVRYAEALIVANRKYNNTIGPAYQKYNDEIEAAYKEWNDARISVWVGLFTKPENRIEIWR